MARAAGGARQRRVVLGAQDAVRRPPLEADRRVRVGPQDEVAVAGVRPPVQQRLPPVGRRDLASGPGLEVPFLGGRSDRDHDVASVRADVLDDDAVGRTAQGVAGPVRAHQQQRRRDRSRRRRGRDDGPSGADLGPGDGVSGPFSRREGRGRECGGAGRRRGRRGGRGRRDGGSAVALYPERHGDAQGDDDQRADGEQPPAAVSRGPACVRVQDLAEPVSQVVRTDRVGPAFQRLGKPIDGLGAVERLLGPLQGDKGRLPRRVDRSLAHPEGRRHLRPAEPRPDLEDDHLALPLRQAENVVDGVSRRTGHRLDGKPAAPDRAALGDDLCSKVRDHGSRVAASVVAADQDDEGVLDRRLRDRPVTQQEEGEPDHREPLRRIQAVETGRQGGPSSHGRPPAPVTRPGPHVQVFIVAFGSGQ